MGSPAATCACHPKLAGTLTAIFWRSTVSSSSSWVAGLPVPPAPATTRGSVAARDSDQRFQDYLRLGLFGPSSFWSEISLVPWVVLRAPGIEAPWLEFGYCRFRYFLPHRGHSVLRQRTIPDLLITSAPQLPLHPYPQVHHAHPQQPSPHS